METLINGKLPPKRQIWRAHALRALLHRNHEKLRRGPKNAIKRNRDKENHAICEIMADKSTTQRSHCTFWAYFRLGCATCRGFSPQSRVAVFVDARRLSRRRSRASRCFETYAGHGRWPSGSGPHRPCNMVTFV